MYNKCFGIDKDKACLGKNTRIGDLFEKEVWLSSWKVKWIYLWNLKIIYIQ